MKRQVSLTDLKVGDEAEITERYPDLLATFQGKVHTANASGVQLGGDLYARGIALRQPGRQILIVSVERGDPPAVRGAVVKFYDPSLLRTIAARHDGDTTWYDLDRGGPVELEGKDWTVLFDPRKDS